MRYSRILHLLSSYRTESSTYMPREESFLVSQDLHCWTKLLREEINDAVRGFEKSQDIWGKNKFNYMDLAGKGRNSVHHYNYSHKFVPMKRSQESSSPTSLWRWKQAHVVSSRGTAYLWDKFVWGNLLKKGSTRCSQVWNWEERCMKSECGSDQRTSGIESYVWFRRLWRSVSQRRMPRETEKHKQKIFHPKQCWIQMKRRQWKRNERRSQRRHTKT